MEVNLCVNWDDEEIYPEKDLDEIITKKAKLWTQGEMFSDWVYEECNNPDLRDEVFMALLDDNQDKLKNVQDKYRSRWRKYVAEAVTENIERVTLDI